MDAISIVLAAQPIVLAAMTWMDVFGALNSPSVLILLEFLETAAWFIPAQFAPRTQVVELALAILGANGAPEIKPAVPKDLLDVCHPSIKIATCTVIDLWIATDAALPKDAAGAKPINLVFPVRRALSLARDSSLTLVPWLKTRKEEALMLVLLLEECFWLLESLDLVLLDLSFIDGKLAKELITVNWNRLCP